MVYDIKLAGMLGQRPFHIRDEATHHGFVERVVKKEHAGLVGNIVCTRISLFNADGGRVVAATAILFDIATGGEAEVCGKVNSYDFAEPIFGGHQQNSSTTAADVNEGRSWDHLLWQRRHHFGKRRRCSGLVARPRCLVVRVDIQSGERDLSGCGNSKAAIEVASGR